MGFQAYSNKEAVTPDGGAGALAGGALRAGVGSVFGLQALLLVAQ